MATQFPEILLQTKVKCLEHSSWYWISEVTFSCKLHVCRSQQFFQVKEWGQLTERPSSLSCGWRKQIGSWGGSQHLSSHCRVLPTSGVQSLISITCMSSDREILNSGWQKFKPIKPVTLYLASLPSTPFLQHSFKSLPYFSLVSSSHTHPLFGLCNQVWYFLFLP